MKSTVSEEDGTITISVSQRFDFSQHRDFRDAYQAHADPGATFEVDLSDTEYMDSSALGMLLVLKEYAESNESKVVLSHPTPEIKRVLEVAHFDRLFPIDP